MKALRIVLPLVAIFLTIGVAFYYGGHHVRAGQPDPGQFAQFLQGVTGIGYAGNRDRPGMIRLSGGDAGKLLALLRSAAEIRPAGAFDPRKADFILSLEKEESLYLLYGNDNGHLYCAYDLLHPRASGQDAERYRPRLAKMVIQKESGELMAILASYRADYDAQFGS